MRIPEAERQVILRDVGNSVADCSLVCSALETLYQRGRDIAYDVKRNTKDGSFVIRIGHGYDIFTSAHVKKMYAISRRIQDVQLVFSKRRVHVHVAAPGTPAHRPRYEPACKRLRRTAIDYAASHVTDDDDVRIMDDIVADVYNSSLRMPNTLFWFEPIVDGIGGYLDHQPSRPNEGVPNPHPIIPLTVEMTTEASLMSADDASESSMGGSRAPESARVGYSLCFSNVPDMSAALLQHFHDTYGTRIAAAYAWLSNDPPLLVVNVRRTTLSSGVDVHRVTSHLPRPLRGQKRKNSSTAAQKTPKDDASEASVSGLERRSKRIRSEAP